MMENKFPREVKQSLPETRIIMCQDLEMWTNMAHIKLLVFVRLGAHTELCQRGEAGGKKLAD